MRRWSVSVFVVLAVIVLVLLAAGELQTEKQTDVESAKAVRLATHTPTVTRTPGWWAEVATWTPTPTGAATASPSVTPVASGTPTPFLPTRAVPTPRPTWTEGAR